VVPEASIGPDPGPVETRQVPRPSKFSNENPSGSIRRWQAAQVGLALCCSMRCRMVIFCAVASSFSDGTLGGGGGGGEPRSCSNTHLPRIVGAVRLGYDVTANMLACPSSPYRFGSSSFTRRNSVP